ncbi:hypothetical protein [Mucilaginibacter sp. 44-25]|nr:hypothetical protein [Mucilaginibacter sp. 44-25]
MIELLSTEKPLVADLPKMIENFIVAIQDAYQRLSKLILLH